MKYVVAVSGGVDSVVLLNRLVNKELPGFEEAQFVVAHFDHGIRDDSAQDAEFVKCLSKDHDLPFELGSKKLGTNVSEDVARQARYDFLNSVLKKHNADAVMTAHHQGDILETAVINIIRGTGWRGLASLGSSETLIRPLLSISKAEILSYAVDRKLKWREDSTNRDEKYLRNYIRRRLIPAAELKDDLFLEKMLIHINNLAKVKEQITAELDTLGASFEKLSDNEARISRYSLIMWPNEVSKEVVYFVLTKLDPQWHPSRQQIERSLHFVKTAQIGKTLQISKQLHIKAAKGVIRFKKV